MASYYILTGAAGFIGSNVLRALNERGVRNIIAVDNLERSEKFRNLLGCQFEDYLDKRDFIERLQAGEFENAVELGRIQVVRGARGETEGGEGITQCVERAETHRSMVGCTAAHVDEFQLLQCAYATDILDHAIHPPDVRRL